MVSQYDDLTGRGDAIQDFLKMIKEKNNEDGKFEDILKKMSPTTEKVENFLRENRPMSPQDFMGGEVKPTEFMGGPMMAYDYDTDPEIIKNIYETINNPLYDKDSRTEAQRQLLRINQGLPRFPKV